MIHVIVDGYNLIRQAPELERHESVSLERGRQKLVQMLGQYKRIKRHKITVVFDGTLNMSEFAPTATEAGIRIKFSPQGVTADDVINSMVTREMNRAVVVSSDRTIQNHALTHGASIIGSPEFYDKLMMSQCGDVPDKDGRHRDKKPAHKRWATYKKGPRKKEPKKNRQHAQRLKKL